MRIVVVLPEPFGPRKPTISPRRTCHRDVVDDGPAAEALGQVAHVDDGVTRSAGEGDIDDLPGRRLRLSAGRPRLDAVDELLAVLDRVDHRRGELGLVGDVGDRRGQPVRAAVAAHVEPVAGREAGERRSRRRRRRACRRRRAGCESDRRGRAGDLAGAAEDVGDLAVGRGGEVALVEPPARRRAPRPRRLRAGSRRRRPPGRGRAGAATASWASSCGDLGARRCRGRRARCRGRPAATTPRSASAVCRVGLALGLAQADAARPRARPR